MEAEGTAFDANVERLLSRLWDDVVKEGREAQRNLHNITHAIMSELRQDKEEQGVLSRDTGEVPER